MVSIQMLGCSHLFQLKQLNLRKPFTMHPGLTLALFYFIPFLSISQNLVDYGGFENTNLNWYECGTVDHYCAGQIPFTTEGITEPASGNCYAGIRVFHGDGNWQEYIYQPFSPGEMTAGTTYKVSLKYSLCDAADHTTDDFGVAFFSNPFNPSTNSINEQFKTAIPQVRNPIGQPMDNATSWSTITGYYTATGSEKYFAIGAFKVDSTITLYPVYTDYFTHNERIVMYVDDISITACPDFIDHPDTLLCEPNTYVIDAFKQDATYTWNNGSTNSSISVPGNGTHTYWVDIQSEDCVFRDYIKVQGFSPTEDLGNDLMICSEKELPKLFTVNQQPGESIIWSDGTTSNIKSIDEIGLFSVEKTFGNCSWTDSIRIRNFHDQLLLYPNPVVEKFSISNDEAIEITRIVSSDGKMIWDGVLPKPQLESIIHQLNPAVYFIQMEGYGCMEQLKFEISH